MKKLILALTLFFSFMVFPKTVHAETTILPPNPITNIRIDTNLKNNAEVTLNNLNMLNSRLYTLVDNDKKLYFCLDESRYYPTGNDYQANLNEKLPSSVLWLMETFYQNQGKIEDVENVPTYKDANELTRYAAIQIVIWKFTGGKFDDKLLTSNPIVNELYTEAKTKPADDHSYQEMIDRLNNVEINATEITPHGEDGDNYLYQLQFEDNLDAETEKLFKIDSNETNINVQLYKNSTIVNITNDITIVDNYNDRTISMEIPKKIIDNNPSEDASIYLNIDTALVTRQPYYLVFGTTGFVQPIGGYQPIKKILTTRASIDLNTSNKSFSVLKHWEDNNNQDGKRPKALKVQLYQSDSPYEYTNTEAVTSGNENKFGDIQVLNKENGWEYIWANLPAENDKGEKFYYTAREELDENSGYNLTIKDTDNGNAILLTNSNDPEKINLAGTKNWDDNNNQDGIRPNNILINLLADGEVVQTVTTNENLGWGYEFNDLPKYKDGKEIVYTVSEQEVPGYSTVINGSTITNTHIPELTEVSGKKVWDDANNKDGIRPESITVNLLADGTKVDSKIVTQKENWTYQFTNLPKYNEGHEIVYTVTENSVPDYSTKIEGTTITNSYTPGETSITVTKAWNDNNNQDGIRPEDIKVQLFANGEKVNSPISLNNSNNWTTTWNNLPEKEGGKAIEYTVKEVDKLDGYDVSINNSNDGDIIITNTHIPEITEVCGKKVWDDANNKDGIRPESITVNLLADGSKIDSKEVSEKENWTYQFTNLPKYNEGHEIVYTVTENSVPDYSTKIEGTTITNSYTPGKTSVTVTKAWNDNNNQDGIRPEDIKVQLFANGEKVNSPISLNNSNNWTTTWNNLPEKEGGKAIEYTVKEVDKLDGYDVSINNSNDGDIIITNTHIPEITEVCGKKVWDDANNKDGIRPESITVNLLADGSKIDSKEVSEKENWTYQFTNLPKYNEGHEIVYTVTENSVPDYSTKIEGTTITNSYTPGKTSVIVTKAWNDSNNQDGLRPDKITVQLYANGKKSGNPVELSDVNNWSTTWDDLALKQSGSDIIYSIKEVGSVIGYTTTVDNSNKGNIIITNSHNTKGTPTNTPNKNFLSKLLPKTGESYNYMFSIVGILILLIVGVLYYFKYKKS